MSASGAGRVQAGYTHDVLVIGFCSRDLCR